MTDKSKEIADGIVEADQEWNEYLETLEAAALGLTVEEYREFTALETDAEKNAYMAGRRI